MQFNFFKKRLIQAVIDHFNRGFNTG